MSLFDSYCNHKLQHSLDRVLNQNTNHNSPILIDKKTNFHPEFEHTEISVYFHTEMVFTKLEIMQRYNGKLSLIFAIFSTNYKLFLQKQ